MASGKGVGNPIPIYRSGDKSVGGTGNPITASATDLDGSDAVLIYTVNNTGYAASDLAMLRKVVVYSRGVNNGGRAHIWIDPAGSTTKECIVSDVIPASSTRGTVLIIEFESNSLDTLYKGILLNQSAEVYIQIEDPAITDGYRAYAIVEDLTAIDGLKAEQ